MNRSFPQMVNRWTNIVVFSMYANSRLDAEPRRPECPYSHAYVHIKWSAREVHVPIGCCPYRINKIPIAFSFIARCPAYTFHHPMWYHRKSIDRVCQQNVFDGRNFRIYGYWMMCRIDKQPTCFVDDTATFIAQLNPHECVECRTLVCKYQPPLGVPSYGWYLLWQMSIYNQFSSYSLTRIYDSVHQLVSWCFNLRR